MSNFRFLNDLLKRSLSVGLLLTSIILALIITIAVYILIMPESKRAGMSGFPAILHDIFQFKSFLVEKIVKFLYVFSTIYLFVFGFFTLFKQFGSGLALMLLGPIVLRIVYELFMLAILLVKNVIDINRKLGPVPASRPAPTQRRASEPRHESAPRRSAAPADTKTCPFCGREIPKAAGFCKYCGKKLETREKTETASEPGKKDEAVPASWNLPDDFT